MTSIHCILVSILCVTASIGIGFLTVSKRLSTLIDSNLLLAEQLKMITDLLLAKKDGGQK